VHAVKPQNYDDERLHAHYVRGRVHTPEVVRLWMEAVSGETGLDGCQWVLDLGAGAGRYSSPLAERFSAQVVGVEPSREMRRLAREQCDTARVTFVGGRAEAIPLADSSMDLVYVSMVLHHLSSLEQASREMARVLRPSGHCCIRSAFKGRLDDYPFYQYFPAAKAIDEERMPATSQVVDALTHVGMSPVCHRVVEQEIDSSLAAHCERLKLRAVSTLELISAAEREAGFRAMEEAARLQQPPRPVIEGIDLLCFLRTG
jgi:ubiquinone/menaquinone biosynthesis C-methylase UbiE